MALDTLIHQVQSGIAEARARPHTCRVYPEAGPTVEPPPAPHPDPAPPLPDAQMRKPVKDPHRLTIDYGLPLAVDDPPPYTHQAKLLELLRKEKNRERLLKMLVPKQKCGEARPTGYSLYRKEQTPLRRRSLEATSGSAASNRTVLAAVNDAWRALAKSDQEAYKDRAKEMIPNWEQKKRAEATAAEAADVQQATRKLFMFEMQLKLGCMSAHCDGQDAWASNRRRRLHGRQCSYTTLMDLAEPDPEKHHRDGATLLAGKPRREGAGPIRSAYDFMEAWSSLGTDSPSHHIVRLPAGCLKFVQAGCAQSGVAQEAPAKAV